MLLITEWWRMRFFCIKCKNGILTMFPGITSDEINIHLKNRHTFWPKHYFYTIFIYNSMLFFSNFSYPYKEEKVLFLGHFFDMEILMNLQVLMSSKSKKHIFTVHINITQKCIVAETSNLVFYVCIISRCHLKHFINIAQILREQRHTKVF